MNNLTFKNKFGFGLMLALMLGVMVAFGASALLPTSEGAIHACTSSQDGQLRVVPATVACGSTEAALQWDRGVIGYAYAPDLATSTETVEFTKGNMNVMVTTISRTDGTHSMCVDLSAAIVAEARFATVNGLAGDLLIRDKDITSNDLDATCGQSYEGVLSSQGLPAYATILVY